MDGRRQVANGGLSKRRQSKAPWPPGESAIRDVVVRDDDHVETGARFRGQSPPVSEVVLVSITGCLAVVADNACRNRSSDAFEE
jgi:hypothetical protein